MLASINLYVLLQQDIHVYESQLETLPLGLASKLLPFIQ
jgi:hypothetical protein